MMSSYLSYRAGLARIDDLRHQADQLRRGRLGSVELESPRSATRREQLQLSGRPLWRALRALRARRAARA
jgi:hypothetical protein